jgi:hypothetical protein
VTVALPCRLLGCSALTTCQGWLRVNGEVRWCSIRGKTLEAHGDRILYPYPPLAALPLAAVEECSVDASADPPLLELRALSNFENWTIEGARA